MTIAKVNITDLQFGDEDPRPKLRRLMEEIRKLQQTVNALIVASAQTADDPVPTLAIGEYHVTVVSGVPPRFVITFNDGGTIRSGSITLS